jgi:hypothetical protein
MLAETSRTMDVTERSGTLARDMVDGEYSTFVFSRSSFTTMCRTLPAKLLVRPSGTIRDAR